MAVTASPYVSFLTTLMQAGHNLMTQDIAMGLLSSAYTPDYVNHDNIDDVAAFLIEENGHSGGYNGGWNLSNKSVTYNATAGAAVFTADPPAWTVMTGTFRYALVWNGVDGNLIGCIDFGEELTRNTEPFDIEFDDGIVSLAMPS